MSQMTEQSPRSIWEPVIGYGPAQLYRATDGRVGWSYERAGHMSCINEQAGVSASSITDAQIATMMLQIDRGGTPSPEAIRRLAQERRDLITLIRAALQTGQ